eukprot:362098-Chlamydomonas_euryale.AAC.1
MLLAVCWAWMKSRHWGHACCIFFHSFLQRAGRRGGSACVCMWAHHSVSGRPGASSEGAARRQQQEPGGAGVGQGVWMRWKGLAGPAPQRRRAERYQASRMGGCYLIFGDLSQAFWCPWQQMLFASGAALSSSVMTC